MRKEERREVRAGWYGRSYYLYGLLPLEIIVAE
jgi:hypothetical protein